MKAQYRNIFFAIGLLAFVLMIVTMKVSFSELWAHLCNAGWWLVGIFGLWLVLYALNALTWRIIIRGSGPCPIPFLHLLKLTISGFALNYATPGGLMGGEPYKIMELQPWIGVERASSSVLLFGMMHIFAHFWYWITAAVLYLLLLPVGGATLLALLFVLLFSGAGVYLFVKGYKHGMVVKFFWFLAKVPGLKKWAAGFVERNSEKLAEIDSQIAALHGQNKRSFYASFLLEYVGRVAQSFEIFIMLLIFTDLPATPMTFVYALIILSLTSLFANLLFFLPLQLGGREGGFAMTVGNLGMTGQVSMSISLLCRVRELFWTAIGLLLIKSFGKKNESIKTK